MHRHPWLEKQDGDSKLELKRDTLKPNAHKLRDAPIEPIAYNSIVITLGQHSQLMSIWFQVHTGRHCNNLKLLTSDVHNQRVERTLFPLLG